MSTEEQYTAPGDGWKLTRQDTVKLIKVSAYSIWFVLLCISLGYLATT